MTDIAAMVGALDNADNTEAQTRRAARALATTGRRLGASDWQTRQLLDMCGLTGETYEPNHIAAHRVRVNVKARRRG